MVPVAASSEADGCRHVDHGRESDQSGAWKSGALAPGTSYVLASGGPPDRTLEMIARAGMVERLRGNPVDVGAGNVTTTVVVSTDLN